MKQLYHKMSIRLPVTPADRKDTPAMHPEPPPEARPQAATEAASRDIARQARSQETRNRILEAAERLFAHHSFAAISMRDITGAAGVALSAANYHFGSKEELFRVVFLQRARQLNRERTDLLAAACAARSGAVVPLRQVLEALLRPAVRWSFEENERSLFIQFLERGHLDHDSPIYQVLHKDLGHLKQFVPHLQAALPELSLEDLYWRLHFALGALHYTITSLARLRALSDGFAGVQGFDETLARILDHCEVSFRAPPRASPPAVAP